MSEITGAPAQTVQPKKSGLLQAVLDSPFAGIAPWIVMSLLSGPGRFEASVCAALGLSLLFFLLGRRRGGSIKLMEIFDLLFFIGFAIVGLLASPAAITWLELWAGEITNISLTVFVVVTILIRQPFTIQYAKETTDKSLWHNPIFLKINYTITAVWAISFGFQAAVGMFGDAVLHNSDNFWTGWILQMAATVAAIGFTGFYPDYRRAQATGGKYPTKLEVFDWIPIFVLITGITGLVTDSLTMIPGIVLIVVGLIGENMLIRRDKARRAAAETEAAPEPATASGG